MEKRCITCFNCIMRVKKNLYHPLNTKLTPVCQDDGIAFIFCREGVWEKIPWIGKSFLTTIKQVDRLGFKCDKWEGEEGEDEEKPNPTAPVV